MQGMIYGIGVGPGDPELMTLKAARLLREADVIAIPGKEKETCTAYQIALGGGSRDRGEGDHPCGVPDDEGRGGAEGEP